MIHLLFQQVFTANLPQIITVQHKLPGYKTSLSKRCHSDKLITFKQSYLSSKCCPITNLPWTVVILTISQARKLESLLTLLFSMMLWISQNHRLDRSLRNQLGGVGGGGRFPGGSVFKNPPGDARDVNSIPGWGRSCAAERLSLCTQLLSLSWRPGAATTEPTNLEAVLHNKSNHCKQQPRHCKKK